MCVNKWVHVMTLHRLSVTNFKIGNISNTIYSRVMKVCHSVACAETFKRIWPWMTLTFGQGYSIYKTFEKKAIFDHISCTIHSSYETLPKGSLRWDLQNDVTLADWVTLTEGQSHSLYVKIGKYPFKNFRQYLGHYLQYSFKTWLKGSLWRDLKKDVTLSASVKVTVFTGNLENIHFRQFLTISRTVFTVELWDLAER